MADTYPLQVEVNEKSIAKLLSVFRKAQREIEREILTATDFGIYNRQAILAQIDAILQDLALKVDTMVQAELPLYYEKGIKNATAQLNNIGADIATNIAFNQINQDAIAVLVDDTARAFAESMTGVSRNVNTLLSKVVREEITQNIAKGLIAGDALKDAIKAIKLTIREQGITALIDKGGRKWTLNRYSEMLYRTKLVEARNRGLINYMVAQEYDLVQVSNHGCDCNLCKPWEGRILSSTGATKGYPTVAEAESSGLFHPNCRHAINALIPSLARKTKAYYPDERTRVISKSEIEKATNLDRPKLPKT